MGILDHGNFPDLLTEEHSEVNILVNTDVLLRQKQILTSTNRSHFNCGINVGNHVIRLQQQYASHQVLPWAVWTDSKLVAVYIQWVKYDYEWEQAKYDYEWEWVKYDYKWGQNDYYSSVMGQALTALVCLPRVQDSPRCCMIIHLLSSPLKFSGQNTGF